jgi:hypothetical protein
MWYIIGFYAVVFLYVYWQYKKHMKDFHKKDKYKDHRNPTTGRLGSKKWKKE